MVQSGSYAFNVHVQVHSSLEASLQSQSGTQRGTVPPSLESFVFYSNRPQCSIGYMFFAASKWPPRVIELTGSICALSPEVRQSCRKRRKASTANVR